MASRVNTRSSVRAGAGSPRTSGVKFVPYDEFIDFVTRADSAGYCIDLFDVDRRRGGYVVHWRKKDFKYQMLLFEDQNP